MEVQGRDVRLSHQRGWLSDRCGKSNQKWMVDGGPPPRLAFELANFVKGMYEL